MAKYCPIKNGPAIYLECKECDEKECLSPHNNSMNTKDKKISTREELSLCQE